MQRRRPATLGKMPTIPGNLISSLCGYRNVKLSVATDAEIKQKINDAVVVKVNLQGSIYLKLVIRFGVDDSSCGGLRPQ
jgi:hypothetical protein